MLLLFLAMKGVAWGQASHEKRQPFVNKIIITGNHYFSDDDLKKQMTTKESGFFSVFRKPRLKPDFLQRDIAVLTAYYHANGFLEATVTLQEIREIEGGAFVDIDIAVVENEAVRVERVTFTNPGVVDEKKLRKDLLLQPGDPFNPSMLASDIYTIKRLHFDEGRLAVAVHDSVEVSDKRVSIHYTIVPGPVIRIRSIEVTGNSDTRLGIIRKEVTLKEGSIFRLKDAVETQRNLFDTGLFTEAEVIPEVLDVEKSEVELTIRVRERKTAYVEVGFGVGNIVGSRIVGEWGERNLFGTGRLLRYKTEYSFNLFGESNVDFLKYWRHEGEYGQRRVFGTKVLFSINAFIEKDATVEDIEIRTLGAGVGGRREFGPYVDVYAQLRPERINRRTVATGEQTSTSIILGSGISHDKRDFILDPRTGSYRDLQAQFAGGPLSGDNDFYTLSSSIQRYLRRGNATVLAVRLRVGFADAFGSSADEGVPVENRYFTGGGNSVRGFRENTLGPRELVADAGTGELRETVVGGDLLILTNVELRFPLPVLSRYRFSGALFADGGNVWDSPRSVRWSDFRLFATADEIRQEDYRYSVGLGLRYNTPVGPIRLDWGLPIKDEDEVNSWGRFHFSLGQMF